MFLCFKEVGSIIDSKNKKKSKKISTFNKKKFRAAFVRYCLISSFLLGNVEWKFGQYCYSVSPYCGWIDSLDYKYFMYYMIASIQQKDFIIFRYRLYIKKALKFKFTTNTGAPIIRHLLQDLATYSFLSNIWLLELQLQIVIFEFTKFIDSFEFTITEILSDPELQLQFIKKLKFQRRLKLSWYFRRAKRNPSWITLSNLPVLPPDLRPIIQLENDQLAISDLNKLYQRVLFRNRRIHEQGRSIHQ